jgi:excisionase family DNA binding protein
MAKPKRPNKSSSNKPKIPPQRSQSSGGGSHPARRRIKAQLPAQPQFITIADAAARLGVSEKTIRRWISASRLAAVRMGSHIRIPLGALLHFIGGLPPAQPPRPKRVP